MSLPAVGARDQATNREQKVTITASSGLTENEIQQMVKDAESHAKEDEARREAIELRNLADSMAYQGEQLIKDHGDKLDSALLLDLEQKIGDVRDVLNNDPENIDRLRSSYQTLTEVLSKAGESMYAQAEAAPTGPNGAEEEPAAEADESTVEGEFREVPN